MEEETLEEKQKYLRENVLEKGYDPDKFMAFLTMKKGEEGINLENWSLEELKEVTTEFLINNRLEIESNLTLEEKEEIKDNKIEHNNENNRNNISCIQIEQTPITKIEKIEIEVSDPKIEKGGIFSFSYSTYLIVTPKLNLQVRRRYYDFLWLYNILKKHFTNCIVPSFFKRKEKLDINKMNERIFYIEKFLNGIAVHPLLRSSKIFYDFISIQDEKEFNKSKYEYGKIQPPSDKTAFKTLNGKIKVSFNIDNEEYFAKIKSKLNNQEETYNKLIYHYKLLLINIKKISLQMKEISNIWKELYTQKKDFFESEITSGVYESYNKIMDKWVDLQNNNSNLIIKSIKKFYRFIKEEYACFKDLSLLVENNKNIYYNKCRKLISARENFSAKYSKDENKQSNSNDNDINIENNEEIEFNKKMSKEILIMNELKRNYGCYLNIYNSEYERLRDLNDIRFKDNIFSFIKNLSSQISNFSFSLSETLSYIDSLNYNNPKKYINIMVPNKNEKEKK